VYPTLTMSSQRAAQRWYEQKLQEPLIDKTLELYVHKIRPRQGVIAACLVGAGLIGAGVAAFGWKKRRKS